MMHLHSVTTCAWIKIQACQHKITGSLVVKARRTHKMIREVVEGLGAPFKCPKFGGGGNKV
jgi:hypothetical protein